ncbi:MAG: hypothetical protein EOL88_02635 [Bacteroidia bacterium]|nr:hypothetical protein [Bacteroidia bacterium]
MTFEGSNETSERKFVELHVACFIFDQPLTQQEIPYFRSAVSKTAGSQFDKFHNHNLSEEGGKYIYRYPLIQYKRIKGKASIVCIGDGTEDIGHFFQHNRHNLSIGNRKAEFRTESIRADKFRLQIWEKYFPLNIINWLALNQKNYGLYRQMTDDSEKIFFLEKILTGNILSFCKGVGLFVQRDVKVQIDEVWASGVTQFKEQTLMWFNVQFRTNICIPYYLGLGKGAGFGFGTILPPAQKNEKAERVP